MPWDKASGAPLDWEKALVRKAGGCMEHLRWVRQGQVSWNCPTQLSLKSGGPREASMTDKGGL